MRHFKDQMGIEREIPDKPQRVISLVPSQTAYLAALGCDKQVVGITKFCIKPDAWFRSKTRVGGTKKVKHEIVAELHPDLIIGNKEENTKEDIIKLRKYPLWLSDVNTFNEAMNMMESLGKIMHKTEKAAEIVNSIKKDRKHFLELGINRRPTVAYVIWRNPFMLVGKDTFIDAMLSEAGFENAVRESRYPDMSLEEIQALEPDYIFLSSEPYPFKDKHLTEWLPYFKRSQIRLVNAVPFSWYGSDLMKAFSYFAELHRQIEL